jgi:hypothetical protein
MTDIKSLAVSLAPKDLFLYSTNPVCNLLIFKMFVLDDTFKTPQAVFFTIDTGVDRSIVMSMDSALAVKGWSITPEISQWMLFMTTALQKT